MYGCKFSSSSLLIPITSHTRQQSARGGEGGGEDTPNKFCRHYLREEEEQRNGWRGGGGKGKGGKSNKRWKEEGKPREEGMFRNANSENNIGLLPLSPPFPVFRSPFAFSSLLPTRFIFLARYDPRALRSLNDLRYSCHFRFIHRL